VRGESVWKIAEASHRASLAARGDRSGLLRPLLAAFVASIWDPFRFSKQFRKGNSQKSISTILHSQNLWERGMAQFPALELIAKHKIGEKLIDIHCGERNRPG
jgi:hypothetical protein